MTKINNSLIKLNESLLERLSLKFEGKFFDIISDVLLLSYTQKDMQKMIRSKNAKKEIFLEKMKNILPLDIGQDCYNAYLDINKNDMEYLQFFEDKESGYGELSYAKDGILIIGIAGSDKSVEDWVDNDARLLVPKGSMVPTQFKVVRKKLFQTIETYKNIYGSKPKEIILTGNSLGGAVAVIGYTELFHYALENKINLKVLTYNSAPVRIEYLQEIFKRIEYFYERPLTRYQLNKFYGNIIHFINEDDLLNNILYKLIKNIENFGHIGRYLIIENKGENKDKDLLHYAREHISVKSLRNLTIAKVQDIEFNARSMIDDSKNVIRRNIRDRITKEIEEYNLNMDLMDRIRGGFLGLALGDFYGHDGKGVYDATKMSIAVAKGIIDNPMDPMEKIGNHFIEWYALDGEGIDETTRVAIENAIVKQDFPTGAKVAYEKLDGKVGGNASLKRVIAVPLFYSSLEMVIIISGLQSNMTHFDAKVKEACQLYSWLVFSMLKRGKKAEALEDVFGNHLYYSQYKYLGIKDIKGSRFAVETLLDALIIFYNSESFEHGIELIKNTSGKEEFGPLAGALLGVCYGKKNIGFHLSKDMKEKNEVLIVAGHLFDKRMKER